MSSTSTRTWTRAPVRRWAMPVSLQPRAPEQCGVIDVRTNRPVRQSALGYHVHPGMRYQIHVVSPGDDWEPMEVSLTGTGALRCESQAACSTADGRTIRALDFQPAPDASRPWGLANLLSYVETITVHLHYPDGRDDFDQTVRVVITPRRTWVLWTVFSLALLYGLIPTLFKGAAAGGQQQFQVALEWLQPLLRPHVWVMLAAVTIGLWLLVVVLDRIRLCADWSQWRRELASRMHTP